MPLGQDVSRAISRRRFAMLCFVAMAGLPACSRKPNPNEEMVPRPDPIPLHVKNENFLDMNLYVVVNGVQRRLGTVSGNAQADFKIDASMVMGQTFAVLAVPIGGRGSANTGQLNVGPDQMISFRIASTLRQSAVSVHEKP
jgi:hypothetical protein